MTPLEQTDFDQRTKTAIAKSMRDQMGPDNVSTNTMRTAGVHYMNAIPSVKASLTGYCKTGVVAGNQRDQELLGNNGKGHANPSFVFSSASNDKYAVHYASNPLDGFHLAEVFDKGKPPNLAVEDAARVAKSQFRLWCHAFAKTVRETRLKIILHCGDAINLCYMLHKEKAEDRHRSTGLPLFLGPWTSKPLILDGFGKPHKRTLFDVIDTSNVADHLGLLNVLPATIPLLKGTASSVLYTETLMCPSEHHVGLLDPHLCLDTSTFSILMGVSPCDLLLGATAYSKITEQMISEINKSHYRIQTTWKIPRMGDLTVRDGDDGENNVVTRSKIHVGSEELGDFFVQFYTTLFACDSLDSYYNVSGITQMFAPLRLRQHFRPPSSHKPLHSRSGFVEILRMSMENINTDWDACLKRITAAIQELENYPLVDCGTQEMLLYMYASGLQTNADLAILPTQQASHPDVKLRSVSITDIPCTPNSPQYILHLVLVVPRSKLQHLRSVADKIGNPGLKISLVHKTRGTRHTFVSLQFFFGSVKRDSRDPSVCDVSEDPLGWVGSSDLIVTCPILKSSLLLASVDEVSVSLSMNNYLSLQSVEKLYGPSLVIWECALTNTEGFLLLNAAPMSGGYVRTSAPLPKITRAEDICVSASIRNGVIESLCYHDQLPNGSEQSKALAKDSNVVVHQSSPCLMTVKIGKTGPRTLVYPFPVDGSQSKTKFSRGSSWIEVEVQLSSAGNAGGYDLKPFPTPVVGSSPELWATPRINIQQQSVVSLHGSLQWLNLHLAIAFTETEKTLLADHPRRSPTRPKNGMLDFRQTLQLVTNCFAGSTPLTDWQPYKGFGLCIKDACELVFYANTLRHDRNTASVFLDAWVIQKAFTSKNLPNKDFLPIYVSEHEIPVWKQFLPSIVERCRNGWDHGERCEYRETGRIPLSVATGAPAICSCGQGKQLDEFPSHPSMSRLARKATRIALHPVFVGPLSTSQASGSSQPPRPSTGAAPGPSQIPASAESKPKCDHCGKQKDGLKACVRCGLVLYCNHACKTAAWKEHKKVCNK